MPRTAKKTKAGGKKKDPNDEPLYQYSKLPAHDKLICWNYYQYTATAGAEGWNPNEAGSVFHQRSSNYLLSLGSSSWFRHRARLMVNLAQKFASLNQVPPDPPSLPHNRQAVAGIIPQFATPPTSPTPRMLSPRAVKAPSVSVAPPVPDLAADGESGLQVPTSFGVYKAFNYTTRKTTTSVLVCMILHNGVENNDVEFEWVTPRRLKLRAAWPEWFQMAEQMAQFTVDDTGKMIFPPEHPLTMDTSERNQALVEEDNRIWDSGYIHFEQDMKIDEIPVFELLDVEIASKKKHINVLQLLVK